MSLATGLQRVPTLSLKDTRASRSGDVPDADLVSSVKADGVLTPLVVRTDGTILDGRLRWQAAKDAGLETVPCHVLSVTEEDVLKANITASVRNVPVRPVEFSRQLKRLIDAHPDLSRADLAAKLGKSAAWVARRLSLLDLCPEAAALVDAGTINLTYAYVLAKFDHDHQRRAIAGL